jgi:hypothetical protein
MTPDPRTCDKTWTLAQVNEAVSEKEAVVGPLIQIGNNGNLTVLTFDTDQGSPAKTAVIAPDVGGAAQIPAGSTKVCSGTIYIAGTLTAATASRPN